MFHPKSLLECDGCCDPERPTLSCCDSGLGPEISLQETGAISIKSDDCSLNTLCSDGADTKAEELERNFQRLHVEDNASDCARSLVQAEPVTSPQYSDLFAQDEDGDTYVINYYVSTFIDVLYHIIVCC